jgi:hypothetical protein
MGGSILGEGTRSVGGKLTTYIGLHGVHHIGNITSSLVVNSAYSSLP